MIPNPQNFSPAARSKYVRPVPFRYTPLVKSSISCQGGGISWLDLRWLVQLNENPVVEAAQMCNFFLALIFRSLRVVGLTPYYTESETLPHSFDFRCRLVSNSTFSNFSGGRQRGEERITKCKNSDLVKNGYSQLWADPKPSSDHLAAPC